MHRHAECAEFNARIGRDRASILFASWPVFASELSRDARFLTISADLPSRLAASPRGPAGMPALSGAALRPGMPADRRAVGGAELHKTERCEKRDQAD